MHILVLGAAGMIGRKLVDRLIADGQVGGREISRFTLFDVVEPSAPAGSAIPAETVAGDLSSPDRRGLSWKAGPT
jgi:nucleoside-diphosphate-sugar epimerase